MSMKSIQVCSLCGKKDCDGIIFETVELVHPIRCDSDTRRMRTCKGSDRYPLENMEGTLYLKQTFGHGDYQYHLVRKVVD